MEAPLISVQSNKKQQLPEFRVIGVMLGVSFTSNMIVSLVAPILPWHLEEIGLPQIWCGVMFGMFPLATLIATPVTKSIIGIFGRVPLLFTGLVVQSLSTMVFGFADELTGGVGANPNACLALFVAARMVCGVGASFANTAIFAIAVERFGGSSEENRLGEVNGWNEVAIGVGFTLGPPFGNSLFLSGGFKLPFIVCATVLLCFSPCAFLLRMPSSSGSGADEDTRPQVGLMDVLEIGMLIPAGSVLLGTSVFGIVEPVLSLYLTNKVGVSAQGIGAVFGAYSFAYAFSSPLAGKLADKVGAGRVCALGTLMSGLIMVVMLGPVESAFEKGSPMKMGWETVGLMLLGIGQSLTLIPTLSAMGQGLGKKAEEPGAEDCVSAWFVMFLNMGLSVGPVAGTAIVNTFGFENAMAICGSGIAAYGAFATLYTSRQQPPRRPTRKMSGVVTIGTPTLASKVHFADLDEVHDLDAPAKLGN